MGELSEDLERMQSLLDAAYNPTLPEGVIHMKDPGAKDELIMWMWAGDYGSCLTDVLDANPELENQLQMRTKSHTSLDAELHAERRRPRLNFLGSLLARNRSKDVMSRHQAVLAVNAKHKMLNQLLWDELSQARAAPLPVCV